MDRKLKVPNNGQKKNGNSKQKPGPMQAIMSKVQMAETLHNQCIKEMRQLYAKMDHDAFMSQFVNTIKATMEADEGNEYAHTALLFCAKFISSYHGQETHPLLIDMCKWLLSTVSHSSHIRYRLCQFVNIILDALGSQAALDDSICCEILRYMVERLHDTAASVREQAILAMSRLQVPDNTDDPVLRAYQFHLCSDPSPRVRKAVITSMARNSRTVPHILERLWDIDEKVRRHTYIHMSSYPVRCYKVSQRLMLLEQGLNDRSETVRKVVIAIMLQQWIEEYEKNFVALVSAWKLDANEAEIDRFRRVTKQALAEIFKRQNVADLVACLPIEECGEFHRCVPHDKLTMELALYWECLTGHLQAESAEELGFILPELSAFCAYIERFCEYKKQDLNMFDMMEFEYQLLSLMEILCAFDLGDETGRGNLKQLLAHLLKNVNVHDKVIQAVVKCAEKLMPDNNIRFQFFIEIVEDVAGLNAEQFNMLQDCTFTKELLDNCSDTDLKMKLCTLKVKILDLEEQKTNIRQGEDYEMFQEIHEKNNAVMEEYNNLLKPLLQNYSNADSSTLPLNPVVKDENILKGLQITFHTVVSPKVPAVNPSICNLYKNFVCAHIASNRMLIRDWALKCATAFSMLYEAFAKDVFSALYCQFSKTTNIRIWETSITCLFELLDRYGLETFTMQTEEEKSRKNARQLYHHSESIETDDESQLNSSNEGENSFIFQMSYLLDTCDDNSVRVAIITGFCRLVLRGYIKNDNIIGKLLILYFNPATDSQINQILGLFIDNLISSNKHGILEPCLLPMLKTVLDASHNSPLAEIRPDKITRFIINATQQKTPTGGDSVHNKMGMKFLQEMVANMGNKELCKILAQEITTLDINVNTTVKGQMKAMADTLIKSNLDPKTTKHIVDFKDKLDGVFNPPPKTAEGNGFDDDEETSTTPTTPTTIATRSHTESETSDAEQQPRQIRSANPQEYKIRRSKKKPARGTTEAAQGNAEVVQRKSLTCDVGSDDAPKEKTAKMSVNESSKRGNDGQDVAKPKQTQGRRGARTIVTREETANNASSASTPVAEEEQIDRSGAVPPSPTSNSATHSKTGHQKD